MMFISDNTGPAHPAIMDAVVAANMGQATPYGVDNITEHARIAVRNVFDAPDAIVEFVSTGSVANALALATFAAPWNGIFCHRIAHVEEDECGAPEFYTGGAKLILIDGAEGKMDARALNTTIERAKGKGVHGVQPGPITLTNITEIGTAYTLDDIKAVTDVAKAHGLPVHMDGARFANACVALNCSPAEMTWKLGIDVVSFGGTKNGCLGAEAVVIFDPANARDLELRRKRGGHLLSKHRYLAAQMAAYLQDDLWLDLARAANARMADLVAALGFIDGARVCYPVAGNMAFVDLPKIAHQRAFAAGAQYYLFPPDAMDHGGDDAPVRCRIVCDWSQTPQAVENLASAWRG